MLALLGSSRTEELLDTQVFARIAPEYHDSVCARIQSQHETGRRATLMDQEYLRLDGARVPVETTAVPIRFLNRNAHLVFVRDITERKRAEAERERLMAAIEQSSEIVVITDTAGTIQYVNPAFERVSGYTRAEALGQNPHVLKSGKHDAPFYAALWQTITDGDTWTGRFINKRKDGSLYTEEASISPVRNAAGRTVNYVAVKRDITEQLRLETELRQAQKMESVGRLAGGVAHDFNNMLSVILGSVELALSAAAPGQPLCADLEEIRKAAERSADLTQQLLTFARKQAVAPRVLDLNDAVSSTLKMLRRLIGENVELAWRPCSLDTTVRIDPSQLDQILANLTVNARDAIAGVGQLVIETGNAALAPHDCAGHEDAHPGDYVTLAVSDTGCGMDAATLEHVFEPFFTTKDVGEGTGLGLATVYGIVQQNGGFITVRSELGNGTSFTVFLPRLPREAASPRKPEAAPCANVDHETILLVEDEPALLKLGKRTLERLGYHVVTAGTPGEAIIWAEQNVGKTDLLITDVIMPEMTGWDLAKHLLTLDPNLRLLFMSGYASDSVAQHDLLSNGALFLPKPFTLKALSAKVAEALSAH
jgi:PAS domain S-box-containing protein